MGHEKRLEARLFRTHPHVQCWRKAEIPARFHYGANPRIPPYFCLAETDWHIAAKLPGLEAGQFFLVREGQVESLAAERSLVRAEQLPDAEILRLAAGV